MISTQTTGKTGVDAARQETAALSELDALARINDAHGALVAALAWADRLPKLDTVLIGAVRSAEVALAAAMVEVREAREAQGLDCPL